MSLKPLSVYAVPERTASVARAAFPDGSLCIRIFDELGTIFQDRDFADLYSQHGQPGQQPFRLALVTVLQFIEGLSDRGAADAVRGRIDWKYLLCLELDDPGFDHSVLCEFRARLLEGGAERILFDKILSALRDKKLVKSRTRQRTDSTHVIAAVRDLNRLERVGETLRAALNVLSTVEPDWVRANVPREWVKRYGKRVDEYRLPEKEKDREAHAAVVGRDGIALLDAIWSADTPEWMRSIPAIETLRRVWVANYLVEDGNVSLRTKDNIPPSTLRINSPYDIEARYSHKRSTTWIGYKVHLTETYDEETPNVITNVMTDEAVINDNFALPKIHQQLSQSELLPNVHVVDAGYIEAQNIVESKKEYQVDLIGPAQNNGRWQHTQGQGFDISHFKIDWEQKKAICPTGKSSSSWIPVKDSRGNDTINIVFAKADCSQCPHLSQCTKAKTKRRTINVRPQEQHEALQSARLREKTKEFKDEYSNRAGIEGSISQGVRAFGLRRSRYIGIAKTRLQHYATAAAINLERVADWFAETRREKTRRSVFVRVMEPVAT
jgi:transposase